MKQIKAENEPKNENASSKNMSTKLRNEDEIRKSDKQNFDQVNILRKSKTHHDQGISDDPL